MLTSAAGNKRANRFARHPSASPTGNGRAAWQGWPTVVRLQSGFTLLELLVVVGIIAVATGAAAFAIRDSAQTSVERDAVRLAALLESARAQSRMRGVPVQWVATPGGFVFSGIPDGVLPRTWLDAGTVAPPGARLELGPEPILGKQSVLLGSSVQTGIAWRVATDGLHPFKVEPP